MKTRRDFLKAAAAAPILGSLCVSTTGSGKPGSPGGEPDQEMIYAGKPMSYWLAQLNSPENELDYEDVESDWVFLYFGVPVLPYLVEALRGNQGDLAAIQLQHMPSSLAVRLLTDALQDQDWRLRAGALRALYGIAVCRHLEPQLTESLRESLPVIARAKWDEVPCVAEAADLLVSEFGPAIEPRCPLPVRRLEAETPMTRALAVQWLGAFRSRADEIVPLLESKLDDPDEDEIVRWAAARTLASFDPNHPAIAPIFVRGVLSGTFIGGFSGLEQVLLKELSVLQNGLLSQHPDVRATVIKALGWSRAEKVWPAIVEMLSDPVPKVRHEAVSASRFFNTPDVPTLLVRALQDENGRVRLQARQQLKWRSLETEKLLADLAELLEFGVCHDRLAAGGRVLAAGRVAATLAVGVLGPEAVRFLPILQRNLEHGDRSVRLAAAIVVHQITSETDHLGLSHCALTERDIHELTKIGPNLDAIVLKLANDLESAELRQKSLELLELLRCHAGPALPHLIELLKSPELNDSVLRCRARRCLAAIGLEAVQPLTELLADAAPHVRTRAIRTLGQLECQAKPATAALMDFVESGNPTERVLAIQALRRIGPEPASCIRILRRLLRDRDLAVRSEAIQALGSMKQEAETAIEDLSDILSEQSLSVHIKCQVIRALTEIGPRSVPVLIQTLNHPDSRIRAHVAGALRDAGREDQHVVALLAKCLLDTHANVRAQAATSLGSIGPRAAPAAAQLRTLLDDPNDIVVLRAEKALAEIEGETSIEWGNVDVS